MRGTRLHDFGPQITPRFCQQSMIRFGYSIACWSMDGASRWGEWEEIGGSGSELAWAYASDARDRLNRCMAKLNCLRGGLPDGHLSSVVEEMRGELFETGHKLERARNLSPDAWTTLEDPVEQAVRVLESLTFALENSLGLDEEARRDSLEQHVTSVRNSLRALESRLPS